MVVKTQLTIIIQPNIFTDKEIRMPIIILISPILFLSKGRKKLLVYILAMSEICKAELLKMEIVLRILEKASETISRKLLLR